jgi:hypothetical protein
MKNVEQILLKLNNRGTEDAQGLEARLKRPVETSVAVGGTPHKRNLPSGEGSAILQARRSTMLLKKYDENKEALKQIGREAIAERRRLGLPISAQDLENEAKDRAEHEEIRVHAAIRR